MSGFLIYKVVNIVDSMIGYKNEIYKDFGWVFVCLDDVLNWIFVCLIVFLIVVIYKGLMFWFDICVDVVLYWFFNVGWFEFVMV